MKDKKILIISIVFILLITMIAGGYSYLNYTYNDSQGINKKDSDGSQINDNESSKDNKNHTTKDNQENDNEESNISESSQLVGEDILKEDNGNTIYDNIACTCQFESKKSNTVICNIKNNSSIKYTVSSVNLSIEGEERSKYKKIEIPVNKVYSFGDEDTFKFKTKYDKNKEYEFTLNYVYYAN